LNDGSVSNVTSTTGRFAVTPSSGALNRGSSLNLTVTFTPTAFGLIKDTLRFNGTVFGGTFRVPVTGSSPVPVLTSSVTELSFGDVDLALPKMLQFTLGNSTVNPLELNAVANTQPQFFVNPSSGIIAPNGSVMISVLFAPSALGVTRDTIQVISNATVPQLRIPISGKGVSSVDVETPGVNVPLVFALDQNYPNPFNPATEISFAVPHQERVVVQVFDVLGQEVAKVVDDVREAGTYRERFDASGLPSGIYIYRMCAGEFTAARRMMILK
ncbi:MAG TPA: choice-of-anchor D domain-containing protein, partial [Bacteroidota bacterium]|nr:choice-of-anchor D domain-containing protein [Bacteroidota bacterium]